MTKPDHKVVTLREELKSLDDRIADAFENELSSTALSALLCEVKQSSADAQEASKAAEVQALDPKLRPADVQAARQQMGDADFRSKRMDAAAEQLEMLLAHAKRAEEAEVRRAAHASAIAERDQLVKDLAAYEAHAVAITDLVKRIASSNQKLHMDHHAERIARGAEPLWNVNADETLPKLIETVRLPKFKRDGTNQGYHWPLRVY